MDTESHRQKEDFLSTPDVGTLTDFSASYENVQKLQPFPLDLGTFGGLVLAIAVPILPVLVAEIPFITVLKALLNAVK